MKSFWRNKSNLKNHSRVFGEIGIGTKHNNKYITSKLNDHGTLSMFVGYAKNHTANVYCMLRLDTNAIIITRNTVWLKKLQRIHEIN